MLSLFAQDKRDRKLDRLGDPLAALDAAVDFQTTTAQVTVRLPKVDYAKGGRTPFPMLLMVKLLVIKQLYNLPDDQVEYQALDRMTFQRFLDLTSSRRIPDSKTIWASRFLVRICQT